ncbi:MAG: hypothetical protein RL693_994 [Verrucomicrobiota bacterium]|jgi:hypothetical protein
MSSQLSSFCADWLGVFPHLRPYKGSRKLILRSATIVYGIELRKIFEDVYRPEFICLNLLSPFNEFCLRREFTVQKNLQADIMHRHHTRDFRLVARTIYEQVPLLSKRTLQPEDIVELYRAHIHHDISRLANPIALMTSLIQQSIYFDLPDVEATERKRLARYCDSLSLEVRHYLNGKIEEELSQSTNQLRENMHLNIARAGWPDAAN